jgi:hypothetical protein
MLSPLFLSLLGSDPAALERALASIRPAAICADVRFIASDELEGRDTPSEGQRLAARYLRARVERLGLEPMGDNGYFDEYTLTSIALDVQATGVTLERPGKSESLQFGRDYFFFGSGVRALDLSGRVVSAGIGAAADYEGLSLGGRFALIQASRKVRWNERIQAAEKAGALGLILAPDPEEKTDFSRWLDGEPAHDVVEGSEERTSLPQLWLSESGAQQLLGGAALPQKGTELPLTLHDRRVLGASHTTILENVCALLRGSDPALAKEVLILSAHYDHVGREGGEIYNGADDNGSGTCGLLAVAEALRAHGSLRRSVLFLWVSGEEKGLWGSSAWTKKPTLATGLVPVLDINIDMIGRNAPEKLLITPTNALKEYNGLTRLAEQFAPLEGFPQLGSADDYWERSDHKNFAENLGIPVAFLFSDVHGDYHQPTDDAEKIDCDKIRRVSRLVVRMLDALQDDRLAL